MCRAQNTARNSRQRLLHEPEEPLQPAPLHPFGSPTDESVVHVERRPHCEEQREGYVLGLETTDHAVDDVALLGEPECDEDMAWAGGEDAGGARFGGRLDPCGVIEGEAGSEHRGDRTVLGLDLVSDRRRRSETTRTEMSRRDEAGGKRIATEETPPRARRALNGSPRRRLAQTIGWPSGRT